MSLKGFDSSQRWIVERRVPLSCPNCTSTLTLGRYVIQSEIPKSLDFHICSHCNFVRSVSDFKKGLFTV